MLMGLSQFKVMLLISVYLCLFIVLLDHLSNTRLCLNQSYLLIYIFSITKVTPFVKLSPAVSETLRIRKGLVNLGLPPFSTVLNWLEYYIHIKLAQDIQRNSGDKGNYSRRIEVWRSDNKEADKTTRNFAAIHQQFS